MKHNETNLMPKNAENSIVKYVTFNVAKKVTTINTY